MRRLFGPVLTGMFLVACGDDGGTGGAGGAGGDGGNAGTTGSTTIGSTTATGSTGSTASTTGVTTGSTASTTGVTTGSTSSTSSSTSSTSSSSTSSSTSSTSSSSTSSSTSSTSSSSTSASTSTGMETCGDGAVGASEACDDGNVANGDGCSDACAIEPGYICTGSPSDCANGTCADPILVNAFPYQLAGTDFTQFDDDGDYATGVGCQSAAGPDEGPDLVFRVDLAPGEAVTISEQTSAGVVLHVLDAAGCGPGAACAVSVDAPEEDGATFTATSAGPVHLAVELESTFGSYEIVIDVDACGNGLIAGQQQCDDGNLFAGDGCSPTCEVELGHGCTGEPSVCTPLPEASCQTPILVTTTPFQYVDTNLGAYGDDADFDAGPGCQDAGAGPGEGADMVFRIDLAQGETVRLRELSAMDTVLHILSAGACSGGPACAASTDAQETNGISYTATAQGPVYLVVESDGVPGVSEAFDVRIDRWACGDGVVDANESCDDANTVGGDGCSAACEFETATAALIGTCTGTIYTYASSQPLPSSIPDGAAAPLDLQFVVPQLGTVQKAAVRLSITHPNAADIDISLAGPGQPLPGVTLSSDNGGSGDNYTNTIFVDGVGQSILGEPAPFTGAFTPESPLDVFAGAVPVAVWTLRINDDFSGNTGTVTFAGLALCITP